MIDFWIFLAYVIGMAIWLRLLVFLNHKSGDIFGLDGVGLLTDIRDFGFSLRDAERAAALLKKEQEAADGTM